MELWDVYTADRAPTGRCVRRGVDALRPGEYHISVHIVLINSLGQLFVQRRATEKKDWPGVWDIAAAAGSALAGETSTQAARRELFEELGLELDFAATAPRMTVTLENCFGDWYVVHADVPVEQLRLQPGEVMDARWADVDEVMTMLNDGRLVDYHPGFIELLTQLDGRAGAMRSWRGRWPQAGVDKKRPSAES